MTRAGILLVALVAAYPGGKQGPILKRFIPENEKAAFTIDLAVDHKDGIYYEGDKLRVSFRPSENCYVWVLDESPDGNVYLLYPLDEKQGNYVEKGTTVTLPADDSKVKFVTRAPFGSETIVVVGSTEPLPKELAGQKLRGAQPVKLEEKHLKAIRPELEDQPAESWAEARIAVETRPR